MRTHAPLKVHQMTPWLFICSTSSLLLFTVTTPPNVQLLYYILPPDQRKSSAVALRQFLTSPAGRGLTVIRAVTLVLSASKEDERTVCLYIATRTSHGYACTSHEHRPHIVTCAPHRGTHIIHAPHMGTCTSHGHIGTHAPQSHTCTSHEHRHTHTSHKHMCTQGCMHLT